MIGVINYGMGNLASVQNALNYIQIPNRIIDEPHEIHKCNRVIIPGVGAFGEAMRRISKSGFAIELKEFAINRQQPVLGICLGMQILLESSTEHGVHQGLGFINGQVDFLGETIIDLTVPHIGWNEVHASQNSTLFNGIAEEERIFYFVHSYYCQINEPAALTGHINYGFDFDVLFEYGNLYGVQFHPEKSQQSGLRLLKNFGSV